MSTEKAVGSGKTARAANADAAPQTPADRLAIARKRFKRSTEAESELRDRMLRDQKFSAGEHWPDKIKVQRINDNRPCLVIDRLTPQIKQVANQQRALRPAIQVDPFDSGADPETAEVFQGLIRQIETSSDADDAYDQAGWHELEIGRGWIRIVTRYCNDGSGNQELRIERVRNPFKIYPDPTVERRDYADQKYAFEASDYLPEELSKRWPHASHTTVAEFQSGLGDEAGQWLDDEKIRVVKYWHVETTREDREGSSKELRRVVCDIMTGLEILETYQWPGKFIPLIPVIADEREIEGKIDIRGMVRGARDPQRNYNFWKSATAEAMALAPKAPFIVAEGQVEPYKHLWKSANTKNYAYLPYKPTTIAGQPVAPPQRQFGEPPIQSMMLNQQAAENDLRATTGFFDVGEQESKEQSGRAILARQQMGEHGNADYLDGLTRAIRFVGRQLVDLIPKIYDVARVVRILGLDNQPKQVIVHAGQPPTAGQPGGDVDPMTGQPTLPDGVKGIYDLSAGNYDVTLTIGSSTMKSARQEFVAQMGEWIKGNPQLLQMFGDLLFENVDVPNAKQIAERFRKMLPPPLRDGGAQADPAALQQQLSAAGGTVQALQAQVQQLTQQLQSKQIEVESKEKIAAAQIDSKERIASLQAELEKIKLVVTANLTAGKLQHAAAAQTSDQGHAGAMAAIEHNHQQALSDRAAAPSALAAEHGGPELPKAA